MASLPGAWSLIGSGVEQKCGPADPGKANLEASFRPD